MVLTRMLTKLHICRHFENLLFLCDSFCMVESIAVAPHAKIHWIVRIQIVSCVSVTRYVSSIRHQVSLALKLLKVDQPTRLKMQFKIFNCGGVAWEKKSWTKWVWKDKHDEKKLPSGIRTSALLNVRFWEQFCPQSESKKNYSLNWSDLS